MLGYLPLVIFHKLGSYGCLIGRFED